MAVYFYGSRGLVVGEISYFLIYISKNRGATLLLGSPLLSEVDNSYLATGNSAAIHPLMPPPRLRTLL